MSSRWMLYSHDALGLGHVRRALAIARAVLAERQGLSALLVTCSTQVGALPAPAGLEILKIPSAFKDGPGSYRPRILEMEPREFRAWRSAILTEIVRGFAPNLVLVDKSPLGLMGELSDAIGWLRRRGETRLVMGWRDILDGRESVLAEWRRERTLETLEHLYDEIWIYGDPRVFDMREAYAMPSWLADRVRYLGYLVTPVSNEEAAAARAGVCPPGQRLAVVTMGGGEQGERVAACFLEAHAAGLLPEDVHALVVTGPLMPAESRRRLQELSTPRARVVSFVPGLEKLIAAADVLVSRAGYNTVCEMLATTTPAVLVPRVLHRDEQLLRARRLEALGAAEMLEEDRLAPSSLASKVRGALARGRRGIDGIRLDGLAQASIHVERFLGRAERVMVG